jgi:hypothetical protein
MIALQFRPIFGALQDLELRPFDAACKDTLGSKSSNVAAANKKQQKGRTRRPSYHESRSGDSGT